MSIIHSAITQCPIPVIPLAESEPLTHASDTHKHLYLIRHGESEFNVADKDGVLRISGESNHVPLTEAGKEQAQQLAKELCKKITKDQKIVICSSTAVRADQTARVVMDEFMMAGFDVTRTEAECFPSICEGKNGPWEGQPRDAKWKIASKQWEALSAVQKYVTPELPEGENHPQLAERAIPTFEAIFDRYPGKLVLVVTHGRVMRMTTLVFNQLLEHLSTDPATPMPTPKLENCDMLVVKKPIGAPITEARVIEQLSVS